MAEKVFDTERLPRPLRATVIRARVDGRTNEAGYIYAVLSDPSSEDALATQGEMVWTPPTSVEPVV